MTVRAYFETANPNLNVQLRFEDGETIQGLVRIMTEPPYDILKLLPFKSSCYESYLDKEVLKEEDVGNYIRLYVV